jgi:transposase
MVTNVAEHTRLVPEGESARIVLGVDTHADQHVVAALDQQGRLLGTRAVPTTPAGYGALLTWATAYGCVERVGIEGTNSYGAGLTRWLRRQGLVVVEVDRPNRRLRHHRGKSDTLDAEAAARAVHAHTATGQPKAGDGAVEAIRVLRMARRSAVKARTQAMNQLHALVVTAPEELRTHLRALSPPALVATVARFRPPAVPQTPLAATRVALKGIAQRYLALTTEITALDHQIAPLVAAVAPALVAIKGVGTDTAGTLLVAAGDNPDRLRSEAAFAHLCGVAPIPASSGKTQRHRLNRGGDRDANRALYLLAIGRLGWDGRTRTYADKRGREGKSKAEIIRCLKRYIAREIYHALMPLPVDNP